MSNVFYDMNQNIQNSNVFLQLFGVHVPYIL